MLEIEKTDIHGWEAAIRGMRNPMNSWKKSDSDYRPILCKRCDNCMSYQLEHWEDCEKCEVEMEISSHKGFMVGPNDHDLMMRLRNAGTDHRKFMRMITVYLDITAPLYWWKEFDAYKIGTVANSCSTMHKIAEKEFVLDDFSHEHLIAREKPLVEGVDAPEPPNAIWLIHRTIQTLNQYRNLYLQTKDKKYWWQMIQLLPSSYNQKRTVMLNYEVLTNIYKSRRNHKLDEWRTFCEWIERLPYSELITGKETNIDSETVEKLVDCGNGYPISPEECRYLMKGESND